MCDENFKWAKKGELIRTLGAFINFLEKDLFSNQIWDCAPMNMRDEEGMWHNLWLGKFHKCMGNINRMIRPAFGVSIFGRAKLISSMFFSKYSFWIDFIPCLIV